MECFYCAGEKPNKEEPYWEDKSIKNGFIGHRLYYGPDDFKMPAKYRETGIYDIDAHLVTAKGRFFRLGYIAARFEHRKSGVIIEFHPCLDRNGKLLAALRNIFNDLSAFDCLRRARKFIKYKTINPKAIVTFERLAEAAAKCRNVNYVSLAFYISEITGKAVGEGAIKMWLQRNGMSLNDFKAVKTVNK